MLSSVPRRFCVISMIAPTYSGGVMIVALTYGSSIERIAVGAGSFDGLSIITIVPSLRTTRKTTDGDVAIRSRS